MSLILRQDYIEDVRCFHHVCICLPRTKWEHEKTRCMRTLKYLILKHIIILSCTKSQETKQKSLNYLFVFPFSPRLGRREGKGTRFRVRMAKTGIMSSRPDVMPQQWRKKTQTTRTESDSAGGEKCHHCMVSLSGDIFHLFNAPQQLGDFRCIWHSLSLGLHVSSALKTK